MISRRSNDEADDVRRFMSRLHSIPDDNLSVLAVNRSPFAFLPPELIAHIILLGSELDSAGELVTHSFRSVNANTSRSFLLKCCLLSHDWNTLVQRLLRRTIYLFGEYAVDNFLESLKRNRENGGGEGNGDDSGVDKIILRMKGKHGHTACVERLLTELKELKKLVIDGKEEYYGKLNLAKQDKWLRKADRLESLSLYHVSHLLASSSSSTTASSPLHLPRLISLSIVTNGIPSSDLIPLLNATPNLTHLSLVDLQPEYEDLVDAILGKKETLRSLHLNSHDQPMGESLEALRRIISQLPDLTTLSVDIAALHQPSPISHSHSIEVLTLFRAAPASPHQSTAVPRAPLSPEETTSVMKAIEGMRGLKVLQVEESIWSERLATICHRRGVWLSVVDYGRGIIVLLMSRVKWML